MTDRPSLDDMTSDQLDQLHDAIDRVRAMHQPIGVVAAAEYGLPPDCAAGCGGDWPCATYTALTEEAGPTATEATALRTRLAALHKQWVAAGPPPLGVPMARWWDRRLVELHGAIHTPANDQPKGQP